MSFEPAVKHSRANLPSFCQLSKDAQLPSNSFLIINQAHCQKFLKQIHVHYFVFKNIKNLWLFSFGIKIFFVLEDQ